MKKYNAIFLGYFWKIPRAILASEYFNLKGIGIEYERSYSSTAVEKLKDVDHLLFDAKKINDNFETNPMFKDVDIIFVGAFGQILKRNLLNLPKVGIVNFHTSYLPTYRGNNPIETQLMDGDTQGGVTMHWIDEGIDTGEVVIQKRYTFSPNDHYPDIFENYHALCAEVIHDLNPNLLIDKKRPLLLSDHQSPICRKFQDSELIIDVNDPSEKTMRKIKAYGHRKIAKIPLSSDSYIHCIRGELIYGNVMSPGRIRSLDPLVIDLKDAQLKLHSYESDKELNLEMNIKR